MARVVQVVLCLCSVLAAAADQGHALRGARVTIGVFVYVCFFTTLISEFKNGGFSSVGAWCAGLCIATIIVALLLCCQLCYFGAVYSGMYSPSAKEQEVAGQVGNVLRH